MPFPPAFYSVKITEIYSHTFESTVLIFEPCTLGKKLFLPIVNVMLNPVKL